MTRNEFLSTMQDVLQTEEELSLDTLLHDLAEWDSLSIMSTMVFLDKNFGVKTSINDFQDMKSIGDIAVKAGLELS